jgi:hypothetical protein
LSSHSAEICTVGGIHLLLLSRFFKHTTDFIIAEWEKQNTKCSQTKNWIKINAIFEQYSQKSLTLHRKQTSILKPREELIGTLRHNVA